MPLSVFPTSALRRALLEWFDVHARALPWRLQALGAGRDPYRVWVSEVLLQQTQVARGQVYFERFMNAFPTVQALAAAPQEAVLKAWEGCGYYARARHLHQAATQVARTGLPRTYEGWLALPGVGPYTAAAIASLAYGEARAVNDGNVRRVMARLHAQAQPTARWVQQQADALLDPKRPGDWNEAVMDLGATLCTPQSPRCSACPLNGFCLAYQSGAPQAYPAPKVRPTVQAVQAVAVVIGDAQHAYLEKRSGTLLGGLYGLPLEVSAGAEAQALSTLLRRLGARAPHRLGTVQHTMTHRRITLQVYAAQSDLPTQRVAQRPLSRLDHKALALLGGQARLFDEGGGNR